MFIYIGYIAITLLYWSGFVFKNKLFNVKLLTFLELVSSHYKTQRHVKHTE